MFLLDYLRAEEQGFTTAHGQHMLASLAPRQRMAMDVNQDGFINRHDLDLLHRIIVGELCFVRVSPPVYDGRVLSAQALTWCPPVAAASLAGLEAPQHNATMFFGFASAEPAMQRKLAAGGFTVDVGRVVKSQHRGHHGLVVSARPTERGATAAVASDDGAWVEHKALLRCEPDAQLGQLGFFAIQMAQLHDRLGKGSTHVNPMFGSSGVSPDHEFAGSFDAALVSNVPLPTFSTGDGVPASDYLFSSPISGFTPLDRVDIAQVPAAHDDSSSQAPVKDAPKHERRDAHSSQAISAVAGK